jgi:phytoene desaturase
MAKIAVIGAGFSGLSAATYLGAAGHEVHIFEKNSAPGGRARQFEAKGYTFDMGPSWYWMPGVFDRFFEDFGFRTTDFYQLRLLNPAFEIVFGKNDSVSIPASYEELCQLFESLEPGSATQLNRFMKQAELKYKLGMENLAYHPGLSILEFAHFGIIKNAIKLHVFSSFRKHVHKYFKHPRIRAIMEFPVLFLGALPQNTPSLYSLMNYAGLKLGTWYPVGGFGKVIDAMMEVGRKLGVQFHFNSPVQEIRVFKNKVTGLWCGGTKIHFDGIIAASDYHHTEQHLLPDGFRNYSSKYWEHKTLAPSCLVFYLGISRKISRLNHHTLFFDEDLQNHGREIYTEPQWPHHPLFYVCCPSKTDASVAPEGHENIFLLMPIAPGLPDEPEIREEYYELMMERLEQHCGENIRNDVNYIKSYCVQDFIKDYNAYKGNAYGLANTLSQTALLKPKIKNHKLSNLFYAGQMTVPGPGVPPSIISGKMAATLLSKQF